MDSLAKRTLRYFEKLVRQDDWHPHKTKFMRVSPAAKAYYMSRDRLVDRAIKADAYYEMADALVTEVRDDYDVILIDCSPSLNLVTINVLTAADSVIIPVEASYLSMAGLQQLLSSIGSIKKKLNRNLDVCGIVINKVNPRTNHEKDIIEKLQSDYGTKLKIFESMILLS